jgi:hypothetical protein
VRGALAAVLLLGAGAASAGESPEARAAREALEPYARSFEIRLIPLSLKKDDDFRSTNYAYQDEKERFYQLRDCFRDGHGPDASTGACKHGQYLTVPRFKAAYEAANQSEGKLDHRKGVAWFCGLIERSRSYFSFYDSTYHGTPVSAVEFTQSVTDAEAAVLKEAYGVDLRKESRYTLARCQEDLTDGFKTTGLIPPDPGPDAHPEPGPAPAERCAPTAYRGVEDLRRLQGEGKRFVWFSGTLWGSWTKDIDTLALLLDCRGPRWVGNFVGAVPAGSDYSGGASFNGCAVRHHEQPATFKDIDWKKVDAPGRRRACRELSRKLKR